ncbi:short-chain dehydrogenase/reductase SDR [Gloeothece citriformis PCC 7424]|uniref:Short-chain dehydrogenase/reductase SDR n=1 Tax=Gloeothece citriformis (strain PCC 7424) TaxID=65393 RepID=B7KEC1_GLOC7|nr:SDR family NAD(P)-dependent oxidoreductase [Gloeothece citriformis]ACK73239.1 short-chain dehydrogenase/reductase SDR [Gloeothece citriformis PCC 7424]
MELSNHTVLITGGSSGIGLELAREFQKRRNHVIVCSRNPQRLALTKEVLGDIETIECDLAIDAELYNLVDFITAKTDKLSILVNNAGIQFNSNFLASELLLENIDQEIAVNFNALVKLSRLCLPLLRQNSQSAIVNISSGLAFSPKKSAPVYCATKAAVHIFSKALRYQMEDQAPNIAVFEGILPLVDTPMTKGRGDGQKISPRQVAQEILSAMEKDQYEIYVGKVKLLMLMRRFLPHLADKILRNS